MRPKKIKPRDPFIQAIIEERKFKPKRVDNKKRRLERKSPRRLARDYQDHTLDHDHDMKGHKHNEDD